MVILQPLVNIFCSQNSPIFWQWAMYSASVSHLILLFIWVSLPSFIHSFIQCVWTEFWWSPSITWVAGTEFRSSSLVQSPPYAETSHWFQDWLFNIPHTIAWSHSCGGCWIATLTQKTAFWKLLHALVFLHTVYSLSISLSGTC